MNKNECKRVRVTQVLGVIMLTWGSIASAVSLSVTPAVQTIGPTDTVDVGILVSGLGDFGPDSLGAFDLDVTFDASILSYQAVTFGDPLLGDQLDIFGLGSITDVVPTSGTVEVLEVSLDDPFDLDSLQASTFQLVTVTFIANAAGTSPIEISIFDLSDANGDPLTADAVNGGTVTVVPIPAGVWLFGAGLVSLMGLASRKAL